MSCTGKPYCKRADVERIFGKMNVGKWANLDNLVAEANYATDVTIQERIDYFCDLATEEFDDRMRFGPVHVPLTGPIPLQVTDVTAKLVGVKLHDGRGVTDYAPPDPNAETFAVSPVATHARFVDKWFRQVHAGRIKLNLASTCPRTPSVLDDYGERGQGYWWHGVWQPWEETRGNHYHD